MLRSKSSLTDVRSKHMNPKMLSCVIKHARSFGRQCCHLPRAWCCGFGCDPRLALRARGGEASFIIQGFIRGFLRRGASENIWEGETFSKPLTLQPRSFAMPFLTRNDGKVLGGGLDIVSAETLESVRVRGRFLVRGFVHTGRVF